MTPSQIETITIVRVGDSQTPELALTGASLVDIVSEDWDRLVHGMQLGNAAGYHLVSVVIEVAAESPLYNRPPLHDTRGKCIREATPATTRAAIVHIRHTGMTLADGKPCDTIRHAEINLAVPIATVPGAYRVPLKTDAGEEVTS